MPVETKQESHKLHMSGVWPDIDYTTLYRDVRTVKDELVSDIEKKLLGDTVKNIIDQTVTSTGQKLLSSVKTIKDEAVADIAKIRKDALLDIETRLPSMFRLLMLKFALAGLALLMLTPMLKLSSTDAVTAFQAATAYISVILGSAMLFVDLLFPAFFAKDFFQMWSAKQGNTDSEHIALARQRFYASLVLIAVAINVVHYFVLKG